MSALAIARATAVGRLLIGAALLVAPERILQPWIGRDAGRPAAKMLGRVVGSRDVALALGALAASPEKGRLSGWLAAALVADAADVVITITAREHLPRQGSALVVATAGAGVALDAAALAGRGTA